MKSEIDDTPVDEAWLRSVGFLPDDRGKEFALTVWEKGVTEHTGDEPAFNVVVGSDGVWLEAFDRHGKSLACIELDVPATRIAVAMLMSALGSPLRKAKGATT